MPWEKILVVNITNGERLETYAIPGQRGSRVFCLNGSAARRGAPGDRITIMSFAQVPMDEAPAHHPHVAVLDAQNNIIEVKQPPSVGEFGAN
jgi:aspartate 1-decarboxylase